MPRLKVGDVMPNFTFRTAYQPACTINSSLRGKTVFWVLRYIGCTSCRYDVHVMAQRYGEFLDKGAQIMVVMQSDPAVVREELKDEKLPFEIICDTNMDIYRALEINPAASKEDMASKDPADIEKMNKKREAIKASGFTHGKYEGDELQLPALFIVNSDGTVAYAHYAKNMADMPTVDEVLELL